MKAVISDCGQRMPHFTTSMVVYGSYSCSYLNEAPLRKASAPLLVAMTASAAAAARIPEPFAPNFVRTTCIAYVSSLARVGCPASKVHDAV